MYFCLVGVISLVRAHIHHDIHEACVVQAKKEVQRSEGIENIAYFLDEFSSPKMLVWAYHQGDDDVVMPLGRASAGL